MIFFRFSLSLSDKQYLAVMQLDIGRLGQAFVSVCCLKNEGIFSSGGGKENTVSLVHHIRRRGSGGTILLSKKFQVASEFRGAIVW